MPEMTIREMIDELDSVRYSRQQFERAALWIFRGWPIKKGVITIRDFFPTAEDMASIGIDVAAMERRAYNRGKDEGLALGYRKGIAEYARSDAHAAIQAASRDSEEIERLRAELQGAREAIADGDARLDARARKARDIEADLEKLKSNLSRRMHEAYMYGREDERKENEHGM